MPSDDDDDWPDADEEAERRRAGALSEPLTFCGMETVILPQGRGEEPKRARVERWVDARGEAGQRLALLQVSHNPSASAATSRR